jgi:hypothetical protein
MKPQEEKPLRPACRALAAAGPDAELPPVVDALVRDWATAHDRLTASLPPLRRLPGPGAFRDWVRGEIESGADRGELADRVEARLATLERVAGEAGRPGTWADRSPVRPRPDKLGAADRLAQACKAVAGSARSTAEAVRRVLAARRGQGVPLYGTYFAESRERYLALLAEAELGLIPKASDTPPPDRPPWGMFRVRGRADAELAGALFRHFPPFPVRSELLEPGVIRPRLVVADPPAPAGAGGTGDSDSNRTGGDR